MDIYPGQANSHIYGTGILNKLADNDSITRKPCMWVDISSVQKPRQWVEHSDDPVVLSLMLGQEGSAQWICCVAIHEFWLWMRLMWMDVHSKERWEFSWNRRGGRNVKVELGVQKIWRAICKKKTNPHLFNQKHHDVYFGNKYNSEPCGHQTKMIILKMWFSPFLKFLLLA